MDEHYSSEEEEVYFGSLSESEVVKRRHFLGSNYDSPVTPRPIILNDIPTGRQVVLGLPDVLNNANTSTPLQRHLPSGSGVKWQHKKVLLDGQYEDVVCLDEPPNNSMITGSGENRLHMRLLIDGQYEDVGVIDASLNNSIITISDESFLENEEPVPKNISLAPSTDNVEERSIHKPEENLDGSLDENIPHDHFGTKSPHTTAEESHVPDQEKSLSKNISVDSTAEKSHMSHEEKSCSIHTSVASSSYTDESKSINESPKKILNNTNILNKITSHDEFDTNSPHEEEHLPVEESCVYYEVNNGSSLLQDIDDFVSESNKLESYATVDQVIDGLSSLIQDNPQSPSSPSSNLSSGAIYHDRETTSPIVSKLTLQKDLSELQKSGNITEHDINSESHGKNSFGISCLNNFEFSLNGISDSVLNISQGSPLPSRQDHLQYHLSNITDISNVDDSSHQEVLHMSVDEIDFNGQRFSDNFAPSSLGNSVNISQPSEYKTCPSALSSYMSAYDGACSQSHSISDQLNTFQGYRDVDSDSDIGIEIDTVSIKSNNENADEGNFEMVVQNRQNSFNSTPAPKITEEKKGEIKVKATSKLPVFQSFKSLLRPPMFQVKPGTLKNSSFKFAKQISMVGDGKTLTNVSKPEVPKVTVSSSINKVSSHLPKENSTPSKKATSCLKTPSKINTPTHNIKNTPKQVPSSTKSRIPSKSSSSENKTTAPTNKTPAQQLTNKTPFKNTVSQTPVQKTSGIPRAVKSDSKVSRILTPSRGYVMNGLSAEKFIPTKNKYKNIVSPIQAYIRGSPPVSIRRAKAITEEPRNPEALESKSDVAQTKLAPKAMQRLQYESAQGQENINPNVLDPTRDTLPPKIFEHSAEVFWKENEQPQQRLPKMGEKLTKILTGSPAAKVTIHESRVNKSPQIKGVLVPNNKISPSTSFENISEQSDPRISVRVQKNLELP